MSETIRDVAIPNSALLTADLLDRYGDVSHHHGVQRQARFESRYPDGREARVLLTERGMGTTAVYKANVTDPLNSSYEIIFTMQSGQAVSEKLKHEGRSIATVDGLPASTGSGLLYGCYGNHVH